MLKLACGKDLETLRIQTKEGVNITAFLDYLEECGKCRRARGTLMEELIKVIGGEKKF